jgi:VWFA-related protein
MLMTLRVDGRASMRISAMVGAILMAGAVAGCLTPPMSPVAMPSRTGQLNLCTGAPTPPPANLAANPNYVEFSVDVIDSSGAPSSGLAQTDFAATDNGKPIPIAYFREEQGRPPVSIGILVDKSGSMVTKLPVVTANVEALLSKLDACDEVFLFAFGMDPILVEDYTTNHTLVGERVKRVSAGGQTPFYDGVRQGLARLDTGHYPDKVAIIYTDDLSSLDNASKRATRDEIVASALNSQNRLFVVGVGKPDAINIPVSIGIGPWALGGTPNGVGAKDLKQFATDMGGGFFLIAAEPNDNAPKVTTRDPNNSFLFGPVVPREYTPLAADPGEVDQVATSIAAQIDRHYIVGVVASAPSASAANQVAIKANAPASRTTSRQIQVSAKTP